jgi:preprotein translocase subunit SecA
MIATNMAGRGTDIQLPSQAKQLGGLHVVIAECNESARIDRQLAGRCGRQGDPGSVVHFLSLEDSLLQRYGAVLLLKLLGFALCNQSLNIIKGPVANFLLQLVQQRAESDAFSRRWSVLQSDDWMESALPFQQD